MDFQTSTSIGEIVKNDFRTAAVFEQYGLDFCCGGKKSLGQGCAEKGIDPEKVLNDVAQLKNTAGRVENFDAWEIDFLADYIVNRHHSFVRNQLQVLTAHLRKLIEVHGSRHPELGSIGSHFEAVKEELIRHMHNEENILFPFIKKLIDIRDGRISKEYPPFVTVENPIRVMVIEHEEAGDALKQIRRLSNNFTPPEDACTTYRVCFAELEEFERDLHQHVHLENNILFPKAIELEKQVNL
ncbi:iron-sulfur cluster repair di-iron protein [bacterium]|nr:iron-sulfur cluster repair di-iron protein [bacterium]